MGEYADMRINGECCESCGEYMGRSIGYARYCAGCQRDQKDAMFAKCPTCKRKVKLIGLSQHIKDKHGAK